LSTKIWVEGKKVKKEIEGFDTLCAKNFSQLIQHPVFCCIYSRIDSFKEAFRRSEGPYRSPMPWGWKKTENIVK
jgi:hypothetical protein